MGRPQPALLAPSSPPWFPDPRQYDAEGLVAIGGDLRSERLLAAYSAGIFPWYNEDVPPLWWSPDPRAVVEASGLHVSRSMRRQIRRGGFEVTMNHSFQAVMESCGTERSEGTWILPEMTRAYTALHEAGYAHSVEVWHDGQLSGGLYGVRIGGLFAAESMFHRVTGASKIALIAAVRTFYESGGKLFDVQFLTDHLASLGAEEISRAEYLERVRRAVETEFLPSTTQRQLNIMEYL